MSEFVEPVVVKEADFNSYDEKHRIVRLSASYRGWDSALLLVTFHPAYKHFFQRVENREVQTWEMSVAELDTLCVAWQQYKADREAWKAEREATQETNPSYGDPFLPDLPDEEEVQPQTK